MVCTLIQSGFINHSVDISMPIVPAVDFSHDWAEFLARVERFFALEELEVSLPPPSSQDELILSTSQIVMESAVSVRGPNLA